MCTWVAVFEPRISFGTAGTASLCLGSLSQQTLDQVKINTFCYNISVDNGAFIVLLLMCYCWRLKYLHSLVVCSIGFMVDSRHCCNGHPLKRKGSPAQVGSQGVHILVHKPFRIVCLFFCRHSLGTVLLQLCRVVFLTFTPLPVLCVVLSQPPAVVMGNRPASQL